MLTLSLGGTYPAPPKTRRGTIVTPNAAVAVCARNLRRVMELIAFRDPDLFFTGPPKLQHTSRIHICRGLPHSATARYSGDDVPAPLCATIRRLRLPLP